MGRIEKQADYYRGFLADDRSLASVATVLVTGVAMWLLFYLVSLVGPAAGPASPTAAGGAAVSRPAVDLTQRGPAR